MLHQVAHLKNGHVHYTSLKGTLVLHPEIAKQLLLAKAIRHLGEELLQSERKKEISYSRRLSLQRHRHHQQQHALDDLLAAQRIQTRHLLKVVSFQPLGLNQQQLHWSFLKEEEQVEEEEKEKEVKGLK
jgi:hypothetical protein